MQFNEGEVAAVLIVGLTIVAVVIFGHTVPVTSDQWHRTAQTCLETGGQLLLSQCVK